MPGTVLFHTSRLDRDDVLNGTIWSESPKVQPEVQAPDQLQGAGALGAQQAMCGDPVLSWVPDLAGRRWCDPEAVIVVGSAYAGFVREYSSRGCTLPLATYRQARTWQDFQEMFVKEVVLADARYYGPVADLLVEAPQGSFVVLDLCRASFVRRGSAEHTRTDESGDAVVREGATSFERYVESAVPSLWLWQRLTHGRGMRIVALGQIAEHGLLRLFVRRGMKVHRHGASSDAGWRPGPGTGGAWISRYADPTQKLESWVERTCWWEVSGSVQGESRRWQILPVLHPSRRQRDPQYERSRAVLRDMLRAAR